MRYIHQLIHRYFPHVEHFAAVSYSACEVFALHHTIMIVSFVLFVVGLFTFVCELRGE